MPKGWVTQVENQGNYKLGNSVDEPEPLLSESAREHKKNLKDTFDAFANSLAENESSEASKVFGSPEGSIQKDSDQNLDHNSIQRLPKENTKSGAELVVIINPIGEEGDTTPEKGKTNRNKSPVKRPHSTPGGASPHKKKKADPP